MKKVFLATLFAAACAPTIAADYFLVTPIPGKTVSRAAIQVALDTSELPSVRMGSAYTYNFKPLLQVTGDAKFTGYGVKWAVSRGSLPPGVSLNSATGVVSGVPSAAGTWPFTLSATYMTKEGVQTYQVAVTSLTVTIAAGAPPAGLVGSAYAFDLAPLLTVSGDPAFTGTGVTWSVVSSSLPAGLSLAADGRIVGTPTAPGTGSVTARAAYQGVNGEQAYEIVVRDFTVALSSATPPPSALGAAYSYDLKNLFTASGDPAYKASDVTWALSAGALPPGLTLGTTGVISGTPTEFADAGLSVTVGATYKNKLAKQSYTFLPKDPYYANVTLLAHLDAEPFTNAKTGATLGSYGGPLASSSAKFGAGAANTNGMGRAVTAPAFRPTGDFTVEGWFMPVSSTAATLLNIGGIDAVNWQPQAIYYNWPAAGQMTWMASSANNGTDISNGTKCAQPCSDYVAFGAPKQNQWNHFAIVYSTADGKYFLYLNGTRTASVTTTKKPFQSNTLVTIGGYPKTTQTNFSTGFPGYVDEIRLTDGVARYTGATYALPAFGSPSR